MSTVHCSLLRAVSVGHYRKDMNLVYSPTVYLSCCACLVLVLGHTWAQSLAMNYYPYPYVYPMNALLVNDAIRGIIQPSVTRYNYRSHRAKVHLIDMAPSGSAPDPHYNPLRPTVVEVNARLVPVTLVFRTSPSVLRVRQVHNSAPRLDSGMVQETSSQDEPAMLRHTVTRPIVQEVRELIAPFRRVVQHILPVQEHLQTIVSRAQPTLPSLPPVDSQPQQQQQTQTPTLEAVPYDPTLEKYRFKSSTDEDVKHHGAYYTVPPQQSSADATRIDQDLPKIYRE